MKNIFTILLIVLAVPFGRILGSGSTDGLTVNINEATCINDSLYVTMTAVNKNEATQKIGQTSITWTGGRKVVEKPENPALRERTKITSHHSENGSLSDETDAVTEKTIRPNEKYIFAKVVPMAKKEAYKIDNITVTVSTSLGDIQIKLPKRSIELGLK